MTEELKMFNSLAELLLEQEDNNAVATPIPTSKLHDRLDLALSEDPVLDADFIANLKSIVKATPKTASKAFFNQLFGGRMPKATLGDLLAVMFNNSMYTYKVAGPQVGIEKEVLSKIAELSGYPASSGGTFAPGGSMSNYMAVLMARDRFDPEIPSKGVRSKLRLYTSEASHYSIQKNASFIGVGRDAVVKINTNDRGEILASHLEKCIKTDLDNGYHPFFVNATSGTTVLGAFDDLEAIAKVCKTFNLWLHVDGAYCGSVIFSDRYKHLVRGLEYSDSFSVNAHKMLGTPLTCSIILAKDKCNLYQSFSNDADYLYQTADDEFNLGKTSLQCGRRNDALKIWTLWKSIGTKGLSNLVEHQFRLADIARDYIVNHPDYSHYGIDDSISVCFNYKDIPAQKLCMELYRNSKLMVGFGQFRDDEFIRMVTINSNLEKEDIYNFFHTLENFVENHINKTAETTT